MSAIRVVKGLKMMLEESQDELLVFTARPVDLKISLFQLKL